MPSASRSRAWCTTSVYPVCRHLRPTVRRDIPVETVVARYTGRLYSMPEFEDALVEEATTGDYAFQVIPGWVIDGAESHVETARCLAKCHGAPPCPPVPPGAWAGHC